MSKITIFCCLFAIICLWAGVVSAADIKDAPILTRDFLDCTNAIPLVCGDVLAGTNVGAPSVVGIYGCISYGMDSGEVVYELTVDYRRTFDIHLVPDGCDLGLFLLSTCDELSCIRHSDGFDPLAPEHITWDLNAGTYYIVVDGYETGNECPYELSVTCSEPLDNGCAILQNASCDAPIEGNNTGGVSYISDSGDCPHPLPNEANGREDWYSITVGPGGSVHASVFFEQTGAALWILDTCEIPFVCLDYYNWNYSSAACYYLNEGTEPNEVFIVVDGYFSGASGPYTLEVDCEGDVVPSEDASWGRVKVMFR